MMLPIAKPILRVAGFAASLILYALTILGAYGGRFNTDIFTFPSVLVLILPWLATATLIVTIIWFCLKRILPGVLGVLAVIASWGPISTVSPIALSKEPKQGAETFTLLTYNMIHGWDQENKPSTSNRTVQYILSTDADIVCLQECMNLDLNGDIPGLTQAQYDSIRERYPYILGDKKYDIKLLSKYPARYVPGTNYITQPYDKRRYCFFKVNVKGREMTVIGVHLMSFMLTEKEREVVTEIRSVETAKESYSELKTDIRDKLTQGFRRRKRDSEILREVIDTIKGPLLICGDFNDVPESYAYRLIRGTDMKDAYVETGFGPLITYNQHAFWFHLDQILYRGDLRALSVKKGKTKVSDHYPLLAEFEFTK